MAKIVIAGCGIIGAAIAYELSLDPKHQITVLEAQAQGGQGATGAALGVMMGAVSTTKNVNLTALRLASLSRYDALIAELETTTGMKIPYHKNGILLLLPEPEEKWHHLIHQRAEQGWRLQWLAQPTLRSLQIHSKAAILSYGDRFVEPKTLVQALITDAVKRGVEFCFNHQVENLTDLQKFNPDWIVVTAGLGTNQILNSTILNPVGGQALRVHLPNFHLPYVIHGNDLNIIPLGNQEFWLGATVEFNSPNLPNDTNIQLLLAATTAICPPFEDAKVLETWAGDRPRPQFQGSPIISFLPNHPQTLIATGHYRNGILMAPVTAQIIKDLITTGKSDLPWQHQQLKI